jgi:phosphoadenosine phosphosulfate reductase
MLTPAEVQSLNREFQDGDTEKILRWAWGYFGPKAGIGTSFQGAGLVMIHLARKNGLDFPVFTIDTGFLFPETVELKSRLEKFFGKSIEALVPDISVEQQDASFGAELWKRDPDLCCTMRKVVPLQSKLAELDCWITGLRREQSDTRSDIAFIELYTFDPNTGREIIKLNPMAAWSRKAVWDYLHDHEIPYNPLHDQGYRSIGCWPCTAKSSDAQNERAGRWTGFNKVECGIHTFMARKA